MSVRPIPEGYHSVTAYLIVNGAAAAIDYYKKAFRASELFRMPGPGGKVMHAEIKIGNSQIMLSDEMPEMGHKSAQTLGGSPVGLMIYCENVDQMFTQAIKAGGTEKKAVQNQFYGDRSGTLTDPFGLVWTIATHVEDVSNEEIQKRVAAMKPGECS